MSTTSDHLPLPTGTEPVRAPGRDASTGRDVWPLVRRLHFYAGVFVAPFLVLAALTGLAYAFTPQLDDLVYGDELRVRSVSGAPRPLAGQVRAAQAAHPEGTVVTVIPPADEHATTAVAMSVPELGEKQRTVYVDPYTGRVTGALTTSSGDTPLTTWLDELHRSLHLGVPGRLYSELAASWLWVIVAGGLLLWLGRRRQYRGRGPARRLVIVDRSARGVRRSRGRHAVAGVWLGTVLLFLSATGLTWSDHAGANFDTVQGALRSSAPELNTARPGSAPSSAGEHSGHDGGTATGTGDPAADVDRVLAAGRAAGLSGPVEIGAPEDVDSVWTVTQVDNAWPVHRDEVAVDAATGQVTARVNWADHPWLAKLSTLGIQFHMGRLFGPANQLLLAATALGLLWIIFWGYRMWWQRRPTRAARTRFGRPPARGASRRLPRTALLLGIPVVALVGYAIPLFGITLLAFLLFDAALAAVRRRTTGGPAGGERAAS
ncbi:PepSY-associated TM helix domain-containing protein [Actinomadura madurae]|uniref:PepSY-associated TM helix domain-containing protein n=1 Tax=Actinomadura madurae TaxID=1993 RepID=UPI002027201A|nr:PepSY domain-containing protein [Actinomadura madurae]MCP9951264.1 PepSY domain-containing protein [Actinomadura madurae]MCP9968034.1 PepSY domain-containing protein [Actinomadura madurae]MCP9980490.1 PepSY domain-containing protein [Actinomadura madurae]MCQ0007994.1 PepSY domain-containing protein [Actinomadura madurae]MCQ0016691.1 PepSY domain-containing protein [Actinomadura madurae]